MGRQSAHSNGLNQKHTQSAHSNEASISAQQPCASSVCRYKKNASAHSYVGKPREKAHTQSVHNDGAPISAQQRAPVRNAPNQRTAMEGLFFFFFANQRTIERQSAHSDGAPIIVQLKTGRALSTPHQKRQKPGKTSVG